MISQGKHELPKNEKEIKSKMLGISHNLCFLLDGRKTRTTGN